MTSRGGATLVELLVVVTVLGIALAVVALSAGPGFAANRPVDHDAVARLRAVALASGRDTSLVVAGSRGAVLVTAFSDGRTITDTLLPSREYHDDSP